MPFPFSDNNQLPPAPYCQTQSVGLGFSLHWHSNHHLQKPTEICACPLSAISNISFLYTGEYFVLKQLMTKCTRKLQLRGFRIVMLLQPFITLWKEEGGNHQKHMTHKEAYDCCIRLVVILAATSEYNLRLLITSFSTESAERMNNIICSSVTMNMVSHFTVWLNWMGIVT